MPFGTYTVKQVDTGDAAYRPDSSMTGLISARTTEGTPLSIQFINSRITKVKLSAEDSVAAKPIPQVTFSIYRNGMAYTTATTGAGGSVELELPFGGYSWVVASAPEGYPVGEIGAFTVENDGTVNGNTVARMAIVSVPLKAVDADGRPVKGVTFSITSAEDSVDNVVTDETGVAAFVAKCETTYNVMVESVPGGMPQAEHAHEPHNGLRRRAARYRALRNNPHHGQAHIDDHRRRHRSQGHVLHGIRRGG